MLENRVPVVLDRVVRAAKYNVTNLGPPIHSTSLEDKKDPAFIKAPDTLFKKRVQLVIPALTALLARAIRDSVSDYLPLAWANISDQLD